MTKIEWCDETWNPITGCSPISRGCKNCYARRMATRFRGRFGYPEDDPFRVTFHENRLTEPEKWRKPKRVFVCSMGDLFHPAVSRRDLQRIFFVMTLYHRMTHHTYMLLTKRPHHMSDLRIIPAPKNIWLGVTAENQMEYDRRAKTLISIPAVVRFVSIEPMLGPVDLASQRLPDWVIVGAETGPGARPMQIEWAQDVRMQCQEAGIPFFFKRASKGDVVPDDLMVREFPPCHGAA